MHPLTTLQPLQRDVACRSVVQMCARHHSRYVSTNHEVLALDTKLNEPIYGGKAVEGFGELYDDDVVVIVMQDEHGG